VLGDSKGVFMLALLTPILPFLEQAVMLLVARPAIRKFIDGVVEAAVSRVIQAIFLKQADDPKFVAAMEALHVEYSSQTTVEGKQAVMAKIVALPHTFK
jgi:hypothetical protein